MAGRLPIFRNQNHHVQNDKRCLLTSKMAEQFDNELNNIQKNCYLCKNNEAHMFLLYRNFFEYEAISRGTKQW